MSCNNAVKHSKSATQTNGCSGIDNSENLPTTKTDIQWHLRYLDGMSNHLGKMVRVYDVINKLRNVVSNEVILSALLDQDFIISRGLVEGAVTEYIAGMEQCPERSEAIQKAIKFFKKGNDPDMNIGHLASFIALRTPNHYFPELTTMLLECDNPFRAIPAIHIAISRGTFPNDTPPDELIKFAEDFDEDGRSEIYASMIARWKDLPQREEYIQAIFNDSERWKDDAYFSQRGQYASVMYGIVQSNTSLNNKMVAWNYLNDNPELEYSTKAMGKMLPYMPENIRAELAKTTFKNRIPANANFSNERSDERLATFSADALPYLTGRQRDKAWNNVMAYLDISDNPYTVYGVVNDVLPSLSAIEQEKINTKLAERFPSYYPEKLAQVQNTYKNRQSNIDLIQ